MADAKLTALTAASALAAADLFYVSQSAASRKATGTQMLALVGTAYVPLAGGTMTGALTLPAGAVGTPSLLFTGSAATTGIYSPAPNTVAISISGTRRFYMDDVGGVVFTNTSFTSGGLFTTAGNMRVSDAATLGWSSTGDPTATQDVLLRRDAAATLAQRNGTNAQTLRVYNTWTDASNGEWGSFGWSGNTLEIKANAIGTGSNRSMRIEAAASVLVGSTLASVYLYVGASHVVVVNSNSIEMRQPVLNSSYGQFTEMTAPSAPATNSVRIYAEDNGAGKTRLMALFATGAAQQLAIEP